MALFNRAFNSAPLCDSLGYFGVQPVHQIHQRELKYRLGHTSLIEMSKLLLSITHKFNLSAPTPTTQRTPPISFAFVDRQSAATVGGVMLSDFDKQGRFFPLVIFNVMRKAQTNNQVAILPLLMQEFLEQAATLVNEDWLNYTEEQLLGFVTRLPKSLDGSSKLKLLEAEVEMLSAHTTHEFWRQLPGFEDEKSQSLYLSALQALLRMIADGRVAKQCVALRIPIPDSETALPFLTFLLQILEVCLSIKSNHWVMFWHHGNKSRNASLVVFFSH